MATIRDWFEENKENSFDLKGFPVATWTRKTKFKLLFHKRYNFGVKTKNLVILHRTFSWFDLLMLQSCILIFKNWLFNEKSNFFSLEQFHFLFR